MCWSNTSRARGTSAGWATHVPSCPLFTSRSLSARTLARAASFAFESPRMGICAALSRVRAGKLREVKSGHDGTWVAHPALVPLARDVFDEWMTGKNQIDRKHDDVRVD